MNMDLTQMKEATRAATKVFLVNIPDRIPVLVITNDVDGARDQVTPSSMALGVIRQFTPHADRQINSSVLRSAQLEWAH